MISFIKNISEKLLYQSIDSGIVRGILRSRLHSPCCLLTIFFIYIFFILSQQAHTAEPLIIKDSISEYSLGKHLEYINDNTGSLTIKDVSSPGINGCYKTFEKETLNFGYTKDVYWVRLIAENNTSDKTSENEWLLEIPYPLLDYISFYSPDDKGGFVESKSGFKYPFYSREIKHTAFLFKIKLKPGERKTYFLSIKTNGTMEIQLKLWKESVYLSDLSSFRYALGIYYGIMLVMMLYNLFIFFAIRDRSYIYYSLFILSYIICQISLNGDAVRYLWPNSPEWGKISISFFTSLTAMALILFSRSFLRLNDKAPIADKIILAIFPCAFASAVLSFFLPYTVSIRISMAVAFTMAAVIIYVAFVLVIRGYRIARFFFFAWMSFLIGATLFILKSNGIIPSVFITAYSMQIGSAFIVILLSLALADRISIMNREKKRAQRDVIEALQNSDKEKDRFLTELKEANERISISEDKYRILVEGSTDIIFILNEKYQFLNINSAVSKYFHIKPEAVISQNFLDLLHQENSGDNITKKHVMGKLEELVREKKPVYFKTYFRSPIKQEPMEMQVKLEYLQLNDRNEILGKASSIIEDQLIKYFQSEIQEFDIGNLLTTAEDISQRLTRNIVKYIDPKEASMIRLTLREIIINAIEHGNLSITFDEKSQALQADNYFSLIAERQHNSEYMNRKVHIWYRLAPDMVSYRITDEGSGFDFKKILSISLDDEVANSLPHGRGIRMAKEVFDRIEYNESGNSVLLEKNIRK